MIIDVSGRIIAPGGQGRHIATGTGPFPEIRRPHGDGGQWWHPFRQEAQIALRQRQRIVRIFLPPDEDEDGMAAKRGPLLQRHWGRLVEARWVETGQQIGFEHHLYPTTHRLRPCTPVDTIAELRAGQ